MKPSTHRKIKELKKKASKTWYKIMYPLAWIINIYEDHQSKKMKENASIEKASKLLAKEIYKSMVKSDYEKDTYVIVAEKTEYDNYTDSERFIKYFTRSNSKGRVMTRKLGFSLSVYNQLVEQIMCEFKRNYKYVEVEKVIEDRFQKDTYDMKGYKCTYNIKILEDK